MLTKEATGRKIQIHISVDIKDVTVGNMLRKIDPLLQYQLSLNKKAPPPLLLWAAATATTTAATAGEADRIPEGGEDAGDGRLLPGARVPRDPRQRRAGDPTSLLMS